MSSPKPSRLRPPEARVVGVPGRLQPLWGVIHGGNWKDIEHWNEQTQSLREEGSAFYQTQNLTRRALLVDRMHIQFWRRHHPPERWSLGTREAPWVILPPEWLCRRQEEPWPSYGHIHQCAWTAPLVFYFVSPEAVLFSLSFSPLLFLFLSIYSLYFYLYRVI